MGRRGNFETFGKSPSGFSSSWGPAPPPSPPSPFWGGLKDLLLPPNVMGKGPGSRWNQPPGISSIAPMISPPKPTFPPSGGGRMGVFRSGGGDVGGGGGGNLSGGNAGTDLFGALRSKINDLTESKPAQLSANAPVGGMPPAGITIQAKGPSVHITQAPPNVNISVSVNVLKPDSAPSATATAIGSELGRQLGSNWGDGTGAGA